MSRRTTEALVTDPEHEDFSDAIIERPFDVSVWADAPKLLMEEDFEPDELARIDREFADAATRSQSGRDDAARTLDALQSAVDALQRQVHVLTVKNDVQSALLGARLRRLVDLLPIARAKPDLGADRTQGHRIASLEAKRVSKVEWFPHLWSRTDRSKDMQVLLVVHEADQGDWTIVGGREHVGLGFETRDEALSEATQLAGDLGLAGPVVAKDLSASRHR